MRHSGINNDVQPFLNPNSTISFNADAEEYLTFHSFTPEAYGVLNLKDDIGSAFVAYLNGVPYLHPIKTEKWNEFFGESVDTVVAISFNKLPQKLKNFFNIEVQSKQMWYVKSIKTNDAYFESEVPPIRMKQVGDKWSGGFLGNKNSPEGLYSGKIPSGYYILVTFIKNNTLNLAYNSIDNAEREKYTELDLLNCKFNFLEQSGFTENI